MSKSVATILWENVTLLMNEKFGGENLTQLAAQAGFGPGTSTRLKKAKTSTGIDTVAKLAKLFEVEPWALLIPGLDATSIKSIGNLVRAAQAVQPKPQDHLPTAAKTASKQSRALPAGAIPLATDIMSAGPGASQIIQLVDNPPAPSPPETKPEPARAAGKKVARGRRV